jgi:LPS O-antigen subunit length determinant protein (WzzB/FepE family)
LFILGFTSFFTLSVIAYSMGITSSYETSAKVSPPSLQDMVYFNELYNFDENEDLVFSKFLAKLRSPNLHKKILIERGFIKKYYPNIVLDNTVLDQMVVKFVNSILIEKPLPSLKVDKIVQRPYIVSFTGNNPEFISEFLNELINKSISETSNEYLQVSNLNLNFIIDRLDQKINNLIVNEKFVRESLIERLKEEQSIKLLELNNKINIEVSSNKKNLLMQINLLKEALEISKSMGSVKNKFDKPVTVRVNENNYYASVPKWYLFGEEALAKEIEVLEQRSFDNYSSPELIALQSELKLAQNNFELQSLQNRKNPNAFIGELASIYAEKRSLGSRVHESIEANSATILAYSFIPSSPNYPNKRRMVIAGFIASFIFSILLLLITSSLKLRKN